MSRKLLESLIVILLLACLLPAQAQDAPDANGETAAPAATDPGAFLDQDFAALLTAAGTAYQEQRYADAVQGYLDYLRWRTNDSQAIYNLACCYGLLGDAELAALTLKRAAQQGFTDVGWVEGDPDFDRVREAPEFADVVAEMQSAIATGTEILGELRVFEGRSLLHCRLHLPMDFDPAQEYKLVVGLHGYGASPENFTKLWERFPHQDFIFATPQAPYTRFSGGEPGYSWRIEHPFHSEGEAELLNANEDEAFAADEAYVLSIVEQLKAEFKVSQVYLMGFSQGCGMSYIFGLKHPEVFSGLICFGGWFDHERLTPEIRAAAKNVRVFIAHGTEDTILEPALGEEARDILTADGYDVTWFSFEGGHRVPPEAVAAADAWLHAE